MKVMLTLLASMIVVGAAFYLVWTNRASEKIASAVIPISVAAIVGILLTIFVFAAEAPINEVFPTVFMYRLDTRMPAALPWILQSRRFTSALFAPAQLFARQPEFFKDRNDENGATLYHHLLQKSLVDWIGTLYRASWQTEILSFDLPNGRERRFQPATGEPEPSKILAPGAITKLLQGNKFSGIDTGIPPQIALPPSAEMTITPAQRKPGALETGEITIKNRFCTVSVRTEESTWLRSIGFYKQLAGLSDEEDGGLATASYIVRFKAEFSRWLSGNPDMPKYKRWAGQLAAEMRAQFDEQTIWRKTSEDYIFMANSVPMVRIEAEYSAVHGQRD